MRLSLFTVLFALLITACSVPKDVTYFQGIDELTPQQIAAMYQTYVSKIAPDDLLTITVTAWDPTITTPFNPPVFTYAGEGETSVVSSQQLHTYLVDKEGYINFPVLGKVYVAGLSKQELIKVLEKEIAVYVKDALVNVQIVNYKVTVIGEITRPGTLYITNDRLSILDAIGRSGDLTINANRTNILVIRDNEGHKEFARMDITDPAIFTSPYYYLRQNDVVYIEPNKVKQKNSRYSQAQQYNVTVFSSILSAISVITTVILALTK
ncbi:MAG: polysaccharide biosynthesis/export family protein [Tannerellaceae bacterium]|nr:polysaccharide biosynthesis/export family protein [Tannerellaceae bacterium]